MRKALILAAGKGIRLDPAGADVPKPMLRVAGEPILARVVKIALAAAAREIYIVVGYKGEMIREYFGGGSRFGASIQYIENPFLENPAKSGLSDAVLLAENIIREPFLAMLGDEIYIGARHVEMAAAFGKSADEAMIAVVENAAPDAIKKNYSVVVDGDFKILDLEEKPVSPSAGLLGCGTYIFKPSVYRYIERTPPSARTGRKELADTIREMIKDSKTVRAFPIGGKYVNINYGEDVRSTEILLSGEDK